MENIIIEPQEEAKAVVIWLHGLGADGNDFVPLVKELNLPEDLAIRFIFPHAPISPVTLNGGMEMRSWFDLKSLELMENVDCAGIRVSCHSIYRLIEEQMKLGIDPKNIVLAGFSQGGLIALHAGLSFDHGLAGIMALSTWLPLPEQFYLHRTTQIFIAHGTQDPVVPFSLGMEMKQELESKGYPVEWHPYPMQHQVCADEVVAISKWLQRVLGEQDV